MRRIVVMISLLAVTLSGVMLTASAQDAPTPEERAAASVLTRKSLFRVLAFNLGPIAGMAQGAPFNAEIIEEFRPRLTDYTVNKKTIRVPVDWKVDKKLLRDMITAQVTSLS